MRLKSVLQDLFVTGYGSMEWAAGKVCVDSRRVTPGDMFVAIPGVNYDGTIFINDAIQRGAVIIVAEFIPVTLPVGISGVIVSSARVAAARLWRSYYGTPDECMQLFGVTGTNGKTTTAFLIHHLLEHAGVSCALLSTVCYRIGKNELPSTQTTPEPETLFKLLAQMKEANISSVAMELSSHALAQERACELRYRCAIFTNLTGDHLDYHGDMENYYQSKKRLFTKLLSPDGVAIINIDDPAGYRLYEELNCRVITMGTTSKANWIITDSGVQINGIDYSIKWPLPGSYNRYNLVGALIAGFDIGISWENLMNALDFPVCVPGRLEHFVSSNGVGFYVDYAHSDDALRNVLQALRPIVSGRLIVVFGAGGNRDRSKRPRMGAVAAKFADVVIVTSDNPRYETPEDIIDEISTGIPPESSVIYCVDRAEAIRQAAKIAVVGDAVLVAGKGHENYQEICGKRFSFDDREVIREFL